MTSGILSQMTATLTCLAAGQNAEDRCDEKKYSKNESEKTIIRYSSQTSAILRVKRLCFKRVSGRTTSEIFLVAASILLAFALSALTSLGWFLVFLVAYGVYLDRRRTARRRSVSGTRISPFVSLSPSLAFVVFSLAFGAMFIGENVATGISVVAVPFLFGVYAAYRFFRPLVGQVFATLTLTTAAFWHEHINGNRSFCRSVGAYELSKTWCGRAQT